MQAVTVGKPLSDAEWWLGVGLGQYGATVAVAKGELEPGVAANDREWPLVATTRRDRGQAGFPGYP